MENLILNAIIFGGYFVIAFVNLIIIRNMKDEIWFRKKFESISDGSFNLIDGILLAMVWPVQILLVTDQILSKWWKKFEKWVW